MEFEITKDVLKMPIFFAERATGKHSSLPILNTILFTAKGNLLTIHATNLTIGVEFVIPAKIIKEGSVAISSTTINTLLGTISESKKITCFVKNNVFSIQTQKNLITLKTYPHEDFPTIPVVNEGDMFVLQAKKLITGFRSVVYGVAQNDTKPEFSGVYIYPEKNNLLFVGTDTYRLAEKKITEKKPLQCSGVIIPQKNVQEIIKIFEEVDDDVSIVSNKNQISFSTETIHVSSRVINAPFPNYQEIFPKTFTSEATMLKQELVNTLKLTTLFSDKTSRVTVSINPPKKELTLSSHGDDVGEQKTNIDAVLQGDATEHDYNARYLLECLPNISQDSVVVKISEEGKMVIGGLGDDTFRYLVAPLMKG